MFSWLKGAIYERCPCIPDPLGGINAGLIFNGTCKLKNPTSLLIRVPVLALATLLSFVCFLGVESISKFPIRSVARGKSNAWDGW